MKKLILGIIAVFCLQVGFTVYNATGPFSYSASTTRNFPQTGTTSTASPNNPAEIPASPDAGLLALNSQDEEPTEVQNETLATAGSNKPGHFRPMTADRRERRAELRFHLDRKTVARSITSRPAEVAPLPKGSEVIFKNEYAAVLISRPSEDYDAVVKESARSEKKSIISRALPIIIKPYDWLKAIGSKIR